jgi:hypothetical protein
MTAYRFVPDIFTKEAMLTCEGSCSSEKPRATMHRFKETISRGFDSAQPTKVFIFACVRCAEDRIWGIEDSTKRRISALPY